MPYVDLERRRELVVEGRPPACAGELNFDLSQTVDLYILTQGMCYSTINDVIGVLECLKMEVYRRIAVPYEDVKIATNGDVFDCIAILPPEYVGK